MYNKDGNLQLTCYIDANWVGSEDDKKSTLGYLFCLGSAAVS
jgi:hypothetical protein